MQYVIALLKNEREIIVSDLRTGKKECLKALQEVDRAIGWLQLLEDKKVENAHNYTLDSLPHCDNYGYSTYRLMIDMEGAPQEYWKEYVKPDDSYYELSLGDYLLIHK